MFLSKHSASSIFLPPSKGYLKTGPLPASKMELAVTIINGSPYMQATRIGHETPGFIVYYPHYCYFINSLALAIILLSLLYLFSSKPEKICTHNSINSFLITSSSVVCCEFNHSPFFIMVRVKHIIKISKFFKEG